MSNQPPINLRPATPSDGDFFLSLYASTRKDEVAVWGWPEHTQSAFLSSQALAQRSSYDQQFPKAQHSIVERSGSSIGRLVVDRSGSEIHLIDISLLPEARGNGVGTTLLTALLEEGRSQGRPVFLRVAPHNPAKNLYARLGFLEVDADPMYITMRWTPCSRP